MDTMLICRQCHAPLPASSVSNLCAACQTGPARTPPTSAFSRAIVPPEPAEIARRFPQLDVLELCGTGGMGMIYKARQPSLDRLVALKILSPALSSDPAFAERFSREAQAMARLSHSNIVAIYDFGRADDYYYFLMEFVDGMNLHTLLQERRLSEGESKRIAVEVCKALQFAHDEGIVHRDIKPANILIDKKGRVKIADFGVAKLFSRDGDATQIPGGQTTMVMGTPNYMAPEQIEHPLEVDHRADLYSLGVVFYEMLTTELPIGRFEPPSHRAHGDARLDEVVLRALAKEPNRRFQTATEIREALEGPATQAVAAPAETTARARVLRWGWLRQLGMMTGSAALALGVYLVAHQLRLRQTGRIPPEAVDALAGVGAGETRAPEGRMPAMRMFRGLDLTPVQTLQVNRIVRRSEAEFTRVERQHTERTRDAQGHVHVTVSPFPVEMQALVHEVWTGLAATLNSNQMERARSLSVERLFPHSGTNTVKVEIWQDPNGDYHFAEEEQLGAGEGHPRAPMEMPSRYRSLLDDKPPKP